MIHLMKLELKKVGLKRYFLFSILGIFLCMFFVFTGLNDKSTSIYDIICCVECGIYNK